MVGSDPIEMGNVEEMAALVRASAEEQRRHAPDGGRLRARFGRVSAPASELETTARTMTTATRTASRSTGVAAAAAQRGLSGPDGRGIRALRAGPG